MYLAMRPSRSLALIHIHQSRSFDSLSQSTCTVMILMILPLRTVAVGMPVTRHPRTGPDGDPTTRSAFSSVISELNTVARKLHQRATAPVQCHALTNFHSVGVLDVLANTPPRASVAKARHDAPLVRFATHVGAIYALVFPPLSTLSRCPHEHPPMARSKACCPALFT